MTFIDISTNFAEEVLRKESTNGKCYHVCYPLSLFLEKNGYPNNIVRGTFKKLGHPKDGTNHYWLQLDGDEGNIIDPTKSQFYPNEELFIHGPKPKEYIDSNNLLKNESEQWLEKYTNLAQVYHKKSFNPNIDSLLSITLRAAILINNDIPDKKKITISPELLEYFESIYSILNYQRLHNKKTMDYFIRQHEQGYKLLLRTFSETLKLS